MPTVPDIPGPYRLFFYSFDCHEPPHVHVEREMSVAKFWLDPDRLENSRGFSRLELRKIERLVSENAALESGTPLDELRRNELSAVLRAARLYGEQGGQMGDAGTMVSDKARLIVRDCKRPVGTLWVHLCDVESGQEPSGTPEVLNSGPE